MENVTFEKANHTYRIGDKLLISVTQLMQKHGLAPDYSGVNAEVLNLKAERGTLIHEEIEQYIKTGEIGFTSELSDFIRFVDELRLDSMRSETIVNNDLVAGTVDLMAERLLGDKTIKALIDYKTSSRVDKEAVRWQLSLYERLSGEQFDEFYVFHLSEKSKYIPLKRIPAEEVDKLLDCERAGALYKPPLPVIATNLLDAAKRAELAVKAAETAKKNAEEHARQFRDQLLAIMKEQQIKSFETSDKSMQITYIEPTTRETIDGTRLKKEQPELAAIYVKTTPVKPSVRITVRE